MSATQEVLIHTVHISMQHDDNADQKRHDARKLFARARRRGVLWVTGTEAGQQELKNILAIAAVDMDYMFFGSKGDVWLAVDRRAMKPNSWSSDFEEVIAHGEGVGKHMPLGIGWVSYDHLRIGKVSHAAGHMLLRSTTGGKKSVIPVNAELNKRFGAAVGEWAREHGKGRRLAFYSGDQNVIDKKHDTFFGAPLTSVWDELKKWPGTGHGNIDVVASYDGDRRVSAAYARVLNDKDFFLNTDHFMVEAGFTVKVPVKKK